MGDLKCFVCLFTGPPPLGREPSEDDPPRDELAVTIVGGNAVCEWHVNGALAGDDWAGRLIAAAKERARAADRAADSGAGPASACSENDDAEGTPTP
jgi:hypothetical protein